MNKIYYSQIDPRWSSHPYPSPALPGATIGSGGCGVTCAAMVISMLKEIVTPVQIADIFVRDGIRVNGGTSNAAFDSYLTSHYGLKCQRNWKLDDAVKCLQNGGIVVTRCIGSRGQLFTTGGHFIVLVGYKDGIIEVYDPYLYSTKFDTAYRRGKATISGTSVFVSYSNMKAYGGYYELWCYDATGVDTNKDDSNIEPAKEVYDRGTVGTTKKFKQNCYLYANPDLSGTYYSYLKNTTVKVLENTSANVDKIYVPATGRTAYVNISNYTDSGSSSNSGSYRVMTVTARSGLNVRSGPGTGNSIVGQLGNGTAITVVGESNGWYQISAPVSGWVSGDYVSSSGGGSVGRNTVGQLKRFKGNTIIYENSNLSGKQWNYLPQTQVKILANVSSSVDKVYVVKTGRVGYVNIGVYK